MCPTRPKFADIETENNFNDSSKSTASTGEYQNYTRRFSISSLNKF